jgi:hypothetical protein
MSVYRGDVGIGERILYVIALNQTAYRLSGRIWMCTITLSEYLPVLNLFMCLKSWRL